MSAITVTTQAEFDAAITEHGQDADVDIVVDSDPGVTLRIESEPTAGRLVVGSASVVRVGGSAHVVRVGDSARVDSVGGSARVDSVGGSARVGSVGGSAHVDWVGGSARVDWVGGSARVDWVGGSARVGSVGDSARVVRVGGSARVDWVGYSARVDSVVDSARVDWVGGSARVGSVGDSARVGSVGDSARVVRVGDSARVDSVGGSARVDWVGGSAHVDSVVDSARVENAAGTSTVHLYAGGTLTHAGSYVAVWLHHQRVTVSGGVIIDVRDLDKTDPGAWCDMHGVRVIDGLAHLYKAVDADLNAGHRYTLTKYPVGATVTDPHWLDDHSCGGGLHTCPTPGFARDHYTSASRYLEVTVPIADLRPIDSTKAKSASVTVVREVDMHGDEVTA